MAVLADAPLEQRLLERHPIADEARAEGLLTAFTCHTSRQETEAGNRLAAEAPVILEGPVESCRAALNVYTTRRCGRVAHALMKLGLHSRAALPVWAAEHRKPD